MKLLYQNMDALDFSVHGAFPEKALKILRKAKEVSHKHFGQKILAYLGSSLMPVHVFPTGAKGGYAFTFDTGPDGAIWFVKDSEEPRAGNIRISCSSLLLALNGYHKAKEIILGQLQDVGVYGDDGDLVNQSSNIILGRFDYCFDFIMDDDFEPDPKHFIIHPRSKARGEIGEKPKYEVQGGYFQSVMVGKMPNRQMIIYDKTAEIVDHAKLYWWDIWGLNKDEFNGSIWRIESRAGKDELKSWNIRTFEQLEAKLGDVVLYNLQKTRFASSTTDTNRSRWPNHPLWDACTDAAQDVLAPYISKAERKKVITDIREAIQERAIKNLRGSVASMNHLMGHESEGVYKTLEFIAQDVVSFAEQNPKEFKKKVNKSKDKYVFLKEGETNN